MLCPSLPRIPLTRTSSPAHLCLIPRASADFICRGGGGVEPPKSRGRVWKGGPRGRRPVWTRKSREKSGRKAPGGNSFRPHDDLMMSVSRVSFWGHMCWVPPPPRPPRAVGKGSPTAAMGLSAWTHPANGEGRCPPPCGPDIEQGHRDSAGALLAQADQGKGRGCQDHRPDWEIKGTGWGEAAAYGGKVLQEGTRVGGERPISAASFRQQSTQASGVMPAPLPSSRDIPLLSAGRQGLDHGSPFEGGGGGGAAETQMPRPTNESLCGPPLPHTLPTRTHKRAAR